MKSPHDPLQRLFKAVAQAARETPVEAPVAVESRILAQWRRRQSPGDHCFALLPLLRRGLVLACLLALAALAFSFRELTPPPSEETDIIESVTEMRFLP